jgi:predicted CXXCH cytochrome family protein
MNSHLRWLKPNSPFLCVILLLHCGGGWSWAEAYSTSGCLGGTSNLTSKAAASVTCLSCHDGAVARTVSTLGGKLDKRDGQWNHPVMVSYEKAYLKQPRGYVPPSSLDKRLHLSQNQVECVTCHTYSEDKHWRPAIPNDRSALCLGCHRK